MELIASADDRWGIGKDGQLLFTVPEDMRRFKGLTTGHIVVMGKGTCLSLPRQTPLPNRINIVLSHDPSFTPEGFVVLPGLAELQEWLKANAAGKKVFVIGGESLYRQLLPCCDRAHITRFFSCFPADRRLPDLDKDPAWRLAATSARYPHQGVYYQFRTYVRKDSNG